jgi:fructoselysine-6-P-deglycase FrlB-like protein/hydroxymethylpyrimidine pyrophosphatase-like HAD family hydrolase
MTVFAAKLDRIVETVDAALRADVRPLARSLHLCSCEPVIAVASGGSAITAEFFSTCRASLGHSPTLVITPMTYVVEAARPQAATWLFSASGDNQDIIAAFELATQVPAASVQVLTSGSHGTLAKMARALPEGHVHIAPVADAKDSFLATHSIVSAAACLVVATDVLSGAKNDGRAKSLLNDAARLISSDARHSMLHTLEGCRERDTIFILHDPHLTAAAVLLETSFWEAGICAVQRTDFRNFAHGRHVWMAKHAKRTFVIALTCERSREIWQMMRHELPVEIPGAHFDFGRAGRGSLFEAILTMLTAVEAAGALKGIDPGRPGVPDYGRRIFGMAHLRREAQRDDVMTRRKRHAECKADLIGRASMPWPERRDRFVEQLRAAEIRGIVLDYDGTVVSTEHRLDTPRSDVLNAVISLAETGLCIGIATGRGGSVGELLREHVPAHFHRDILIGYYNGAHIVSLESDIRKHQPTCDALIAGLSSRLCGQQLFTRDWSPREGPLQISIPFDKLAPEVSPLDVIDAVLSGSEDVKIVCSGHSMDVIPGWAGKSRVVDAIVVTRRIPKDTVLRIGDSGDAQGNDFELLEGPLGLSVDRVCHRDDSCWNLLPVGINGPDGLLRVLTALTPVANGVAKLDVSALFSHR